MFFRIQPWGRRIEPDGPLYTEANQSVLRKASQIRQTPAGRKRPQKKQRRSCNREGEFHHSTSISIRTQTDRDRRILICATRNFCNRPLPITHYTRLFHQIGHTRMNHTKNVPNRHSSYPTGRRADVLFREEKARHKKGTPPFMEYPSACRKSGKATFSRGIRPGCAQELSANSGQFPHLRAEKCFLRRTRRRRKRILISFAPAGANSARLFRQSGTV